MDRARHLLRSSLIVIVFLGLGKLTGLLRTRLVGTAFGTSLDFDAFTAANQLPEVFVTLISGGALAAAFIPVYSAYLTDERSRDAARLANSILTLVMAVLGGLSALGILLAPWLTRAILVPDFDSTTQALTAEIMQVILLQTTLFGISGVLSSILNANQHFALPALAPIALDAGYLIGLHFFVPSLGVVGLAWGTVCGGALHILIQVPALMRYRFRYRPALDLSLSGVKEVIRLMGPRVVTLGTVQLADLFIINLTSGLGQGSTSSYFYGYYLMQLPETLFGTAIAIVIFPTMAERFNAGDLHGLKSTAASALGIIWTLTIPAAALLLLLGRPAIALFLQQGAFTAASTSLVYGVLVYFSVRIVSEASLEILARLFYAQHDTKTPMLVALFWLVISVGAAYALVDPLGVGGLALASTMAFSVQAAVLYALNKKRLGSLSGGRLAQSALRALLGTAAMTVAIQAIGQLVTSPLPLLATSAIIAPIVYAGTITLAGGRELRDLLRLLRGGLSAS